MAVVENAGINMVGSSNRTDPNANVPKEVGVGGDHHHNLSNKTSTGTTNHQNPPAPRSTKPPPSTDQDFQLNLMPHQQQNMVISPQNGNGGNNVQPTANQKSHQQMSAGIQQQHHSLNGNGLSDSNHSNDDNSDQDINGLEDIEESVDDGGEGFKREMRDLEDMLSKLNPMAEEFVPPSLAANNPLRLLTPAGPFGYAANNFVIQTNPGIPNGNSTRRVNSLNTLVSFHCH